MTTIEHALLGINGALAAGVQRRWGWQIVALAAVGANLPDWDGAFFLYPDLIEAHRVWGHNLLACLLLGALIGAIDYRFDLATRAAAPLARRLRLQVPDGQLDRRTDWRPAGWATWILVAVLAALSHLAADMVISGTDQLPDWELQLLWPFSHRGWVLPLLDWGRPDVTIIFVIGMFAMARWRSHVRPVACVTLACVAVYLAAQPLTSLGSGLDF